MNDMDRELDVSELPEMQHAFAEIQKELSGENEEDDGNEIEIDQDTGEDEDEGESDSDDDATEDSEPAGQELEEAEEDHEQEEVEVQESEVEAEEEEDFEYQQRKVKKLRQYRQEKNELIAQREYLREENERLKRSLRDQEYKVKYSEGETIYNQLENAISKKKQALEDGDVEEIVRADINLIKAQNKVAELEEWIEEEKSKLDNSEEEVSSPEEVVSQQVIQELSHEWLKENPDLNPRSVYYDQNKANNVKGFIDYLDKYLVEENLEHLYYTPQYFEQIDQYKQSINSTPKKSSYSAVAPVKHTVSAVVQQKAARPTITLSAQEKMMAQNMGITPEEWLKYKIEQYQEGQYA